MRNAVRIAMACVCGLIAAVPISSAWAADHITTYVPHAEKVGDGRLTVMFWDIYDASLYAPHGRWSTAQPFALRLSYLRDIPGHKIADKSIEEIRKQGFDNEIRLADWHAQLTRIFPDVDDQTSLTGIYTQSGTTYFFSNSRAIGRITDPEFGHYFFDIWLGQKTTAPALRAQLLGRS